MLYGGDGDDYITDSSLAGTVGNVGLYGGASNDSFGIAGHSSGDILIDGGDGNDTIRSVDATRYHVTLDGGTGSDFLQIRIAGAAHIDAAGISTALEAVTPIQAVSFQNFEVFDIILSTARDWVKLGAGNDSIVDFGGGGAIRSGAGDDSVGLRIDKSVFADGGSGFDTVGVSVRTDNYTLTVNQITGIVTDNLGSTLKGFESVSVNADFNVAFKCQINFGKGADNFFASIGQSTVMGFDGNDTIVGATLADGGNGNDELFAYGAGTVLMGGAGDDHLYTRAGNTSMNGGDGLDRIEMDWNTCFATGGAGADTFVIGPTTGLDHRITDFVSGTDMLQLADSRVATLTVLGAGDLAWDVATAASAQYVAHYDAATNLTRLFFDDDGTGSAAAVLLVSLNGQINLQASDVWIF